jgi:hypothetical protein
VTNSDGTRTSHASNVCRRPSIQHFFQNAATIQPPVPWANTSSSDTQSISFGPTIPDVDQQLCCDLGRRPWSWWTGGPRANPVARGGADVVAVGFSRGRPPGRNRLGPCRPPRPWLPQYCTTSVSAVGCSRSTQTCDVRVLRISHPSVLSFAMENHFCYSDASSHFMVTG